MKALAFDLYGTLTTKFLDFEIIKKAVSSEIGRKVEDLRALLNETWGTELYKTSYNTIKKFELYTINYGEPQIFPEVRTTLRKLNREFELFLVSLLSMEAVDALLNKFNLKWIFKSTITRKDAPDRLIQMRLLTKKFDLKPVEILMIDDDENNLRAIKGEGYHVVLMDREGKKADLELKTVRSLKDLTSLLKF
jgi:HAD superfamily hydrolase (TIGR01509 family)